jgi:hypothetical protein
MIRSALIRKMIIGVAPSLAAVILAAGGATAGQPGTIRG